MRKYCSVQVELCDIEKKKCFPRNRTLEDYVNPGICTVLKICSIIDLSKIYHNYFSLFLLNVSMSRIKVEKGFYETLINDPSIGPGGYR